MATDRANDGNKPFSWLDPHMLFVIIMVGQDETPFAIQKDFLCARSSFYRDFFAEHNSDQLERVVRLPDTSPEVFGLAQNFLYTGSVSTGVETPAGYDVLISTWKLGSKLGIDGLCDEVIKAMKECRRVTQHIPATPLLVQAWKDTPENSSIRQLLLTWAAEYIRSSESRSQFSKSLPQEVLSELVVAMSQLSQVSVAQANDMVSVPDGATHRKNVHYVDTDDSEVEERKEKVPKARRSDVAPRPAPERKPSAGRKAGARSSLPNMKPTKGRRISVNNATAQDFTNEQKLYYCSDLIGKMLSGPGFWTRLVGPFRTPVNPEEDGVPDYLEKIKKPMDLGTIKEKMDSKEYNTPEEFCTDIHQIFENCYQYWNKGDPIWTACEKLEKTFEERYSQMPKFLAKIFSEENA